MFADPRKVRVRRLKRRIKAGASIVVALAAGLFLACKGDEKPPPSPSGPDARSGPLPAPREAGAAERLGTDARTAGSDMPKDAVAPGDGGGADARGAEGGGTSSAVVVRDGGIDSKKPQVDREQHRKGMPVHDNLIE
jgi:hypothetical protein